MAKTLGRIYDTIHQYDIENKNGILVILDFAKTFDTLESFLVKYCLELFNYADNNMSMYNFFKINLFPRVEQNGHPSSIIQISQGCRQGYPLSPYICVICSDICADVVRGSDGVKGIDIMGCEIKLSQYANDATVF